MTPSSGITPLPLHLNAASVDLVAAFAGRRAVVLGASGFLGRWTARALRDAGASVIAVARDAGRARAALRAWGVTCDVVACDVLDPGAPALVASLGADVVFNLVGYGVDRSERDEVIAERTNVSFVRALAEAIAATTGGSWDGARLVHVGSALEYGLARGVLAEDGEVRPHTSYGRTKLAATRAVQEVAIRTGARLVIARLFTVFGAGEHETRLLPTLQRAAREGSDVSLSAGLQRRDFTAADEVAEGLLRLACATLPPGAIVNLASGRLTTVRDFAATAAAVLGIAAGRLRFGTEKVRSDEMDPAGVAIERLRAATGWSPSTDLSSAIARMVAAERA